jgi:hypothetical protein
MANWQAAGAGAASGAAAGSVAGPWGAAAGGVIGGAAGLFSPESPDAGNALALATPNQNTPYGQRRWSQGPDGRWTQDTTYSPEMQGANNSLMTQWGQNAAAGYGNGDTARNQAIDASWGQFQRMNEPLMAQRENKSRSDLLNMGLDMGSQGYDTGFGNTLRANDAQRLNAQDQAIAAGDRAQAKTFQQNRQSWLDPLTAMEGMNSLLTMPGAGGLVNAGQAQFGNEQQVYENQNAQMTGLLEGGATVAGAIGGMPSLGGAAGGGGNFAYGAAPKNDLPWNYAAGLKVR